jgi:DNA-nicking Smr family endonuclease
MTDNSDHDFFASAMKGVKPLDDNKRSKRVGIFNHPKPKPIPRVAKSDGAGMLSELHSDAPSDADITSGEDLRYARDGVQAGVLKKLRRGAYEMQDQIDLHGMNAQDGHQYVADFLDYAVSENLRAVRIVHGKGNHSQQGPVLKRQIGHWLRQRGDVLAYVSARQTDGGAGALYVLLSR